MAASRHSTAADEAPTAPLEVFCEKVSGETVPIGVPDGEHESGSFESLVLGRYRLRRQLGSGGFGVVWEAYDEQLQRLVAVKQIGGSARRHKRAQREALAAARLSHPNVTQLYELATDGNVTYLVSELVHGTDLAQLLDEEDVSDRDVAKIGIAICEALQHAHGRGVVHRDVKPQNIMVLDRFSVDAGIAKLMDFGVARLAQAEPLTGTGDVVGTLAYMAPEQAAGQMAGSAADVYALALTLYEAWAAHNPVRAEGAAETVRRIGRGLPSLGSLRPDLPPELTDAIDAALAVKPHARPGCEELKEALLETADDLDDSNSVIRARGGDALFGGLMPVAPAWVGRIAYAGAIAALTALGAGALDVELPVSGAMLVVLAGLSALFLPRVAWLGLAFGVVFWSASGTVGRPGQALVLALALALPVVALPAAKRLWALPAGGPLLGLAGIPAVFVGIAGIVRGAWRRAMLGAIGAIWLEVVAVASQRDLAGPVPVSSTGLSSWQGSAGDALHQAIWPLLTPEVGLLAACWAAFAVLLPIVVRGRSLTFDVVTAVLWSGALAVSQREILELGGNVWVSADRGGAALLAALVIAALGALHVARATRGRRVARGRT